jgi:TM2 domain-containing membrane protein YozV
MSRLIDCPDCGEECSSVAVSCPSCGRPIGKRCDKSRFLAAILALLFGQIGLHKFYLSQPKRGLLRVLVSLTIIGLVVTELWALWDGIVLLLMSDAAFARKYARSPIAY